MAASGDPWPTAATGFADPARRAAVVRRANPGVVLARRAIVGLAVHHALARRTPARLADDLPSFVDVVRTRAWEDPERPTFTFLGEQDGHADVLTAGETDRRARAIAARLQALGAAGERAVIMLPPGLDYIAAFYGCLYAGAVAVPVYPPGLASFGRSLARLEGIVRDSSPRFVVTSTALALGRGPLVERAPLLGQPHWIAADDPADDVAGAWRPPALERSDLALLQYTSGSTGTPKGVMVTHGNLLHNTERMRRLLGGAPDDRHVGWLPPYHDMGLVAGILMVSQFGMVVTLMSPLAFIKRPGRWLRALSDNRATITGGAPFGFDLAATRIPDAELAGLDLSSIRVVCIAAEPVRPATLDRFVARFGPLGFRRDAFLPCYGLAESTLMATGAAAERPVVTRTFSRRALRDGRLDTRVDDADDGLGMVGCGPPIDGLDLAVVDPETRRPCAPGRVGEIWLSGASVASGYWRRPEQTAREFEAPLDDPGRSGRSAGRYLRTGDLGGIVDGELFVAGRLKDMMIVHGVKHHPEDLEGTLDGLHPSLCPAGAAVFSVDDGHTEGVVVVHEVVTRGLERDAVAAALREAVVREHGLDPAAIVLIRARTLPKTSSGKVRRQACREAFLAGGLESTVFVWRNPRLGPRAVRGEER
jgi:acyl-CoA synthetase (AMP-forming)/AMP-acid ligase II